MHHYVSAYFRGERLWKEGMQDFIWNCWLCSTLPPRSNFLGYIFSSFTDTFLPTPKGGNYLPFRVLIFENWHRMLAFSWFQTLERHYRFSENRVKVYIAQLVLQFKTAHGRSLLRAPCSHPVIQLFGFIIRRQLDGPEDKGFGLQPWLSETLLSIHWGASKSNEATLNITDDIRLYQPKQVRLESPFLEATVTTFLNYFRGISSTTYVLHQDKQPRVDLTFQIILCTINCHTKNSFW